MKILLHLLKNNLIQQCRINQLRYADSKKRRNTIYLYILVGAILMGLLAYLGYSLNIIFSLPWTVDDIITSLILPIVMICIVLDFFISILWGSGLLLSDTNMDALLALPVPLIVLTISKISVLYFVQVILDLALLLPMTVLFGLTAGARISYYPLMVVVVLLLPIIPSLLGTIAGTGLYRILKSSSARVARLKTIAAVLILSAFMTFMFWKFPDIAASDISFSFSISAVIAPVSRYVRLILYNDYLSLGLYIGVVLLVGIILLYGLSNIFHNWYVNTIQSIKCKMNEGSFKQSSLMSALLARERTRYFSLPVYLTNTACGFLFAIVFVMLIVLAADKINPYIYRLAVYFQIAPAEYDVLYIYIITILAALSSTTYPSISIEGKQIEILKSLPVTAKDVFKSKVLHHLSVAVPIILILNTIMAFNLHWSWAKVILGYAMPLIYSLFIGVAGCLINLIFPNFEWENVTQIIKQSIPAVLSALIGMFLTCTTIYLLLECFPASLLLGSYTMCGIILMLIIVMELWLNKRGVRLYQEL